MRGEIEGTETRKENTSRRDRDNDASQTTETFSK